MCLRTLLLLVRGFHNFSTILEVWAEADHSEAHDVLFTFAQENLESRIFNDWNELAFNLCLVAKGVWQIKIRVNNRRWKYILTKKFVQVCFIKLELLMHLLPSGVVKMFRILFINCDQKSVNKRGCHHLIDLFLELGRVHYNSLGRL